jgi:hypothetical protein
MDLKFAGVGINVGGSVFTSSTDWEKRSGNVYMNFTGPFKKPKFLSPAEI